MKKLSGSNWCSSPSPDAEDLALHAVNDVRGSSRQKSRPGRPSAAGAAPCGRRHVLHAAGHPNIVEHLVPQRLAHALGNLAAGDAVVNPEAADGLVRLDTVSPFFTMGWEKQVGLKSMPSRAPWRTPPRG